MVIEGLLNTAQVAERLGSNIPYVHNLVKQGKFPPGQKIRQQCYWQPEQVNEYLTGLQVKREKTQEQSKGLLSSEQVAQRLGCNRSTLSGYVKDCKFPPGAENRQATLLAVGAGG
ncbi:MAG: helix-turn-helix domain-containing protein [Synergistaceae bacterium]|nr:helix-turn-helix domain-containing protein [Synergistaceae bacterium]